MENPAFRKSPGVEDQWRVERNDSMTLKWWTYLTVMPQAVKAGVLSESRNLQGCIPRLAFLPAHYRNRAWAMLWNLKEKHVPVCHSLMVGKNSKRPKMNETIGEMDAYIIIYPRPHVSYATHDFKTLSPHDHIGAARSYLLIHKLLYHYSTLWQHCAFHYILGNQNSYDTFYNVLGFLTTGL